MILMRIIYRNSDKDVILIGYSQCKRASAFSYILTKIWNSNDKQVKWWFNRRKSLFVNCSYVILLHDAALQSEGMPLSGRLDEYFNASSPVFFKVRYSILDFIQTQTYNLTSSLIMMCSGTKDLKYKTVREHLSLGVFHLLSLCSKWILDFRRWFQNICSRFLWLISQWMKLSWCFN